MIVPVVNPREGDPFVPGRFDEIEIGQVAPLGEVRVDARALEAFTEAFASGGPVLRVAPDARVYALLSRLDAVAAAG